MGNYVKLANAILTGIIIFFLSLFLYALLRSGSHPPGYMNIYYYIFISCILLFSYILFKCKVESKLKIILLIFSITISIGFTEIILSYYNPARPERSRANYAKSLGFPFDSRSIEQVLMDLRNKGIDAYVNSNQTMWPSDLKYFEGRDIIPIGFVADKTSILPCNEGGEYIIYKSDEHGFNNPKGLYDKNNIDYVLIGDSFTQGICVKREENIAGNLTNSGEKVLNMGMPNSGPLIQLAILKEYVKPVKPKNVFWLFYEGNDYEGLEFEKKLLIYLKYLDTEFTQDLFFKQHNINDIQIEYHDKKYSEKIKQLKSITEKTDEIMSKKGNARFNLNRSSLKLFHIRRRLGMFGIGQCEWKTDPLLIDVFVEAKRLIDEWEGKLTFVYLPEWSRYPEKINRCRKRFLNTGKKEVLSIIRELQIPIVDIESVFSSHPDPLSLFPFRIYGHYNAEGYKVVAEHLEKYIRKQEK